MPGRSTAPWARRKRLRKRRRAYLRRALASTPPRVLRAVTLRYSRQRAWIAEQLRAHHTGLLLRLRLTRASAATPRLRASRWLTGLAFEYARLVPLRARASLDTRHTFVIDTNDLRKRCVVCGDMQDQNLIVEPPRELTEVKHSPRKPWPMISCKTFTSFPRVRGVPYVFERMFVRATLHDGSVAVGVLSVEHTKHLRSDVSSVSHANTVGQAATLMYYDTADVLCRLSLHSAIRIDTLRLEPFSVICRDGYALSVHFCADETWPLGRIVVRCKNILVWHAPRSNSHGLWSAGDRHVQTFVDGRGLRTLVQHSNICVCHSNIAMLKRAISLIRWKKK